MTVTLAFADHTNKTSYIGTDSCASDSINHSIVKNNKVFHPVGRKDILIGIAGTFRMPNLLQYIPGIFPPEDELATDDIDMSYLVNEFTPIIKAITEDFDDSDAWEILIAVGDRIYRMQMDLSIIEPVDDMDAIGLGGSVALGAFKVLNELEPDMPVEDRIKHALKVACDTCQGCLPPFQLMNTEKLDDEILAKAKENRDNREKSGYEVIRREDEASDSTLKKKKKKKK